MKTFVAARYTRGMDHVLRHVDDLSEASRQSLEGLLGRPLEPHQAVWIVVLNSAPPPSSTPHEAAVAGLRELLQAAGAHAGAADVSEAEVDLAVEEAMRSVRGR